MVPFVQGQAEVDRVFALSYDHRAHIYWLSEDSLFVACERQMNRNLRRWKELRLESGTGRRCCPRGCFRLNWRPSWVFLRPFLDLWVHDTRGEERLGSSPLVLTEARWPQLWVLDHGRILCSLPFRSSDLRFFFLYSWLFCPLTVFMDHLHAPGRFLVHTGPWLGLPSIKVRAPGHCWGTGRSEVLED